MHCRSVVKGLFHNGKCLYQLRIRNIAFIMVIRNAFVIVRPRNAAGWLAAGRPDGYFNMMREGAQWRGLL